MMTKTQAEMFVCQTDDEDEIDTDDLTAAFVAIYEREPDQHDYDVGIWSLLCAAAR